MKNNKISKELKQTYENIDDVWYNLSDIRYYLNYIPEEYYEEVSNISNNIRKFRQKCINNIDTPLIALKNYTEHKCSWERAGMMCDLHIFGLRKYCEEQGVNWGELRIDEYFGVEGDDGLNKIKENWRRLDPDGEFQPINYTGDSLYTKYPHLTNTTKSENVYNDVNENYIKYKAKMLISEYSCEFYKALNYFVEKNPEYEEEVSFYKEKSFNKDLKKFSNGIEVTNKDDLEFLEFKLDLCYLFIKDGIESNDLENILNSYYKLKDILVDEYYYYTINQDKKPKSVEGKKIMEG